MYKKESAFIGAGSSNFVLLQSQPPGLGVLEADELRNQVQRTLSTLGEADRRALLQHLISELTKFGGQIGPSLFILGISATSTDELTPSDMGMLLRYFRINSPYIIEALAEQLAELLFAQTQAAKKI
jgi:hypothetical protein